MGDSTYAASRSLNPTETTMPTQPKTKIDATTSVNIGILITMLGAVWYFATNLGQLRSGIDRLNEQTADVKRAIDRNTAQLASDGKTLSALQAVVSSLQERVGKLEQR